MTTPRGETVPGAMGQQSVTPCRASTAMNICGRRSLVAQVCGVDPATYFSSSVLSSPSE
jgi:hypothetical protein